jgi:hypothetical protein
LTESWMMELAFEDRLHLAAHASSRTLIYRYAFCCIADVILQMELLLDDAGIYEQYITG